MWASPIILANELVDPVLREHRLWHPPAVLVIIPRIESPIGVAESVVYGRLFVFAHVIVWEGAVPCGDDLLEDWELLDGQIVVNREYIIWGFKPGPDCNKQELRENKLKERLSVITYCWIFTEFPTSRSWEVCGLDENFKPETGYYSSNNCDGLYFGLEPCVTSIVFHSDDKVNTDCQFEAAEYRKIDDVGISLTHIIAVLYLRH